MDMNPEQREKSCPPRSPEEDAAFGAAVRKGVKQADRGEFVSEQDMDSRLRRMTCDGTVPRCPISTH
jgi:hypothetical protein